MKTLACLHCSAEFIARSIFSNTKYCSHLCRFKSKLPDSFGEGCFIWPMSKNTVSGYGQFNTYDGDKVITSYAHRMSYEAFIGILNDGDVVLHKCDNPSCVNPRHLSKGSQADNMEDMKSKGRYRKYTGWVDKDNNPQHVYPERRPKGDSHGASKLRSDDVVFIRQSKASHAELGRKYGVSDVTISNVRSGKTWAHLLQNSG